MLQTTGIAYRDETWRLALAGDAPALRAAAELLDGYDAHRAAAFAEANEGRLGRALDELHGGVEGGWPFPAVVALDAARVCYLGGDDDGAIGLLAGATRSDPAVLEVALLVSARTKRLRRRAVGVVPLRRAHRLLRGS